MATPGRHLVLVKDNRFNPLHLEMVYNQPDVEAARVVWARSLDPERDRRLLAHFADRVLWEFVWLPGPEPAYSLRTIR